MAQTHGGGLKRSYVRCEQCGIGIEDKPSAYRRYCSRACVNAARRDRPAAESKRCGRCKVTLPLDQFGAFTRKNRTPGKVYYATYCLACRRASTEPSTTRRYSLKKRYGITPEHFDAMLEEQGGCGSCGSLTTDGKYWHIDHDHSCCPSSDRTCGNCIRGVLCHGCNTALGNLGDSAQRVEQLLTYIRRHDG